MRKLNKNIALAWKEIKFKIGTENIIKKTVIQLIKLTQRYKK